MPKPTEPGSYWLKYQGEWHVVEVDSMFEIGYPWDECPGFMDQHLEEAWGPKVEPPK